VEMEREDVGVGEKKRGAAASGAHNIPRRVGLRRNFTASLT